jgi:4-hydroxybenzoate polyprenyltransferase
MSQPTDLPSDQVKPLSTSFKTRLRIYLNERFPVGPYTLLVLALVLSGYALVPALSHASGPLQLDWASLAGLITVWLIFFHLRLFDEFKDLETDRRFHPERPVPRGLVTLRELRALAAIVVASEITLSLWLGWPVFLFYLAILLYSLLMYKEFFVGSWLRRDLLVYALTHTPIMLLMGLYIYALYALSHELPIAPALGFYLAICFLTGLAFEIARKVRAPEDEREGLETYSQYFGTRRVPPVLILLLGASTFCAWGAGWAAHFSIYYYALTLLALVIVSLAIWRFRTHPNQKRAQSLSLYASLYALVLYVLIILESVLVRGIALKF